MALSATGPPGWSPRRRARGDAAALWLLVALPIAVFVVPALAGHPAVVGDNLLQNYPLRVLAGRELGQGHWPLWNPYADAGTPLIGGMNAGALYPGTLLFAVLPGLVAWVANLLVVYWAAGIGAYTLCRWLGAAPLPSAVAALTYAYAGMMLGQLIHLGVVEGQSLLPWLALCTLSLSRTVLASPPATRARGVVRAARAPVAWLAVLCGLVCLTGEPRAIVDAALVLGVLVVVELASRTGATARRRVAFAVGAAVGAAWGACLGAVQLLPGWGFVAVSERAQIPYHFFAAGSLSVRWLALGLVPGLLGGNGVAGTAQYFGSYNLPEVTFYAGLGCALAVAAATAQLLGRGVAPRRTLVAFLGLVVVGACLAVGPNTVIGPLLHDVPLLGRTRLQSRSLAVSDLGAIVLLAWWLDAVLAGRRDEASLTGRRLPVTVAPLLATVALCAAALASPAWATRSLLADAGTARLAATARSLVAGSLVLATGYLVAVWRARRPGAGRALVGVCVADVVCGAVLLASGLVAGVPSVTPSRTAALATFGTVGRSAIVDPGVLDYHEVVPLGLGDLSALSRLPSVQGYGSLLSARYADATGTRLLGRLDGCDLADGAFVPLRLATIVAATNALQTTRGTAGAESTCGAAPTTRAVRYLGVDERVRSVRFDVPVGVGGASPARVVLLGPTGRVERVERALVRGATLVARFGPSARAAAVELTSARPVAVGSTTIVAASGARQRLDTWLQAGLDAGGWRLVGVTGPLSVFKAPSVRPATWLVGPGVTRVVSSAETGTTRVEVWARAPSTLVWSEAWLPGWQASVTRAGGATRVLAVRPRGLVQSVAVPAGFSVVTFSYVAPHFAAGLLTSALALAAVLVLAAVVATRRRRSPPAPAARGVG